MPITHLVAWSQVLGLVVGLLGSFYLALGVFGKDDVNYFRPLLPAVAAALSTPLLWSFAPAQMPLPWVLAFVVVNAFFGYFIGLKDPLPFMDSQQYQVMRTGTRLVAALGIIIGIAAGLTRIPGLQFWVFTLANWALLFLISDATRTLDKELLKRIGFAASVFAVATQFIPPVLDLLNIKPG
jgi:hypothetical protein